MKKTVTAKSILKRKIVCLVLILSFAVSMDMFAFTVGYAVIRIKTPNEAENIYHTVDSKGRRHFYMSEYCANPKYVYVNKRVKERVKWKKVKTKSGYVWKYKNKYVTKKVKKRTTQRYRKDSYVYNLGII